MEVAIVTNGSTVWVNDPYGCLGRFGPRGIDVHRSVTEQMADKGECL